jgi:cell division protein WhiA
MAAGSGFTEAVRQELASRPVASGEETWAELVGLARCAGRLTVVGGTGDPDERNRLTLASTSGAVARRIYALLQQRFELRPELAVRAAGGVRQRATFEVRLAAATVPVAVDLGLMDRSGRLVSALPVSAGHEHAAATLRGAVLACASFSAPGREPHLELVPGSGTAARGIADLLAGELDTHVGVVGEEPHRVVVKSGEGIGDLLVLVGATNAFLRWDEHRMRRQLRGEANRLANADAANLRRTVDAASEQIRAVEAAIDRVGWEALDDDLRDVALARLANPGATLQEVGRLVDPPVGKSAVHRRLQRLLELGAADGATEGEPG